MLSFTIFEAWVAHAFPPKVSVYSASANSDRLVEEFTEHILMDCLVLGKDGSGTSAVRFQWMMWIVGCDGDVVGAGLR